MSSPKIVHISAYHPPLDNRIFFRECLSLKRHGFEVHLICSIPQDEVRQGVYLHSIFTQRGTSRFLFYSLLLWRILRKSLELRAHLYHIHEITLVPIGVILAFLGYKVIYDVHEDYPEQAIIDNLHRPYWGKLLAFIWILLDSIAKNTFCAFVVAAPKTSLRFPPSKTIVLLNTPRLELFSYSSSVTYEKRPYDGVYLGFMNQARGICELVESFSLSQKLNRCLFIGWFSSEIKEKVRQLKGWEKVEFLGWLPPDQAFQRLFLAKIGFLLFYPGPHHNNLIPNKLFEYMAAGLPLVVSHIPYWKQFLHSPFGECGIMVDPKNPEEIAAAVDRLLSNPALAKQMGEAGRKNVESRWCWEKEEKKLIRLYQRVLA